LIEVNRLVWAEAYEQPLTDLVRTETEMAGRSLGECRSAAEPAGVFRLSENPTPMSPI
jgi:hypothetical protein